MRYEWEHGSEFVSWRNEDIHGRDGGCAMYRLKLLDRDTREMEAWRLDQIMKGLQLIEDALANVDTSSTS